MFVKIIDQFVGKSHVKIEKFSKGVGIILFVWEDEF